MDGLTYTVTYISKATVAAIGHQQEAVAQWMIRGDVFLLSILFEQDGSCLGRCVNLK